MDSFSLQKLKTKHIIILGALFHLLAVLCSEGFHRPDEHLGLMRFVGYKLGILNATDALSSWEYPARIRPWLQPAFYVALLKPFTLLGLKDPFILTTILRFISSLLGFASILLLLKKIPELIKDPFNQKITTLLFMSLWFLPFFHARTTAENLGISFFIFAMFSRSSFLLGFLSGVSFIFRFQMAFMIAPYFLWLILFKKINLKNFIKLCIGFGIALILMVFVDYWGYGEWTFTPWNYYYQNIIKNVAAGFGVDPWYYYIVRTLNRGIPPLGLLFLLAPLYLWIKHPKHYLTWITLPYFVVHSMIGHKEVRFIFALALFLPLIIGMFLERFKLPKWLITILLIQNTILLFIASTKDAHTPIEFYKYLYNKKESTPVIYTMNRVIDQLKFYQKEPIEMIHLDSMSEAEELIKTGEKLYFLTDRISEAQKFDAYNSCEVEFSTYPKWLTKTFPKIAKRSKAWSLTKCNYQQ